MEVLGAKYANMLWLPKHVGLSVPKENIALSLITWTVVPVVYLLSRKSYSKWYTGSTESFQSRFNNYKPVDRKFSKGNTVKQVLFHTHFEDDKHHGMHDSKITLIDQTDSVDNCRRRESFWHD